MQVATVDVVAGGLGNDLEAAILRGGADDQLGRLNLITPEKVRQGAAEVREGRTFCLSLPLDLPGGNVLNPRRYPPAVRPTLRNGKPNLNYRLITDNPLHNDVISDDLANFEADKLKEFDAIIFSNTTGELFTGKAFGQRCAFSFTFTARPIVFVFEFGARD